jgi:drug/metabolite transporter (DMT)-like permease
MSETFVKNPLQVFIYAMGSTVLFSLMNLGVKFAAENGAHITQIMLFRNLLALPVVLWLITRHSQAKNLLKTQRPITHLSRGIVGIIAMACFFLSFKMLPLGDATALHFASPLLLTALSVPLLGEKVGIWRWSAVAIGLVGVIIIANPTGNANLLGSFIALMAAFLSAIAAILVRRMGDTEHSLTIVFYFTVCGIIISFVLCPFFWTPIDSVWVFYTLICVGLLGGFAQFLMTKSYTLAPAGYVSVFSYSAIIYSIAFDAIFWFHFPAWNIWIGSIIIIGSGLLILYRELIHKNRADKPSPYALTPLAETEIDLSDKNKH